MDEDRIPKMVLYSELADGCRKVGGQKLRYKDVVKRHLKSMSIDPENWENLAKDRNTWRYSLYKGRDEIEKKIKDASEMRHYRRHNPGSHECDACPLTFHTERGLLQHRRMKHRSTD